MAMQSFELQVYKGGKWEFDSYFDDRETALFEAERLHDSDRYHGIRILEELFRDDSATSECSVIFSRLRKAEAPDDPRAQASREAYRMAVRQITKPDRQKKSGTRNSQRNRKNKSRSAAASRKSAGPQSQTSLTTLLILSVLIVIVGVGAMIALRYMEGNL